MSIHRVLAALPVRDLAESVDFYTRLRGRSYGVAPMPSLAQWDFAPTGGLQLVEVPESAGGAMVTLLLTDFDATIAGLRDHGFALGEVVTGVISRLTAVRDPSGNTVTLAEVPADQD